MDQQQFSLSYGSNIYADDYLYSDSPTDYYDLYDNEFVNTHDEQSSFWSHLTFHQLCAQCVLPAVWSTCNLLGTTLISCIFFRLFIVISNKFRIVPEAVSHIVCAVCGVLPILLFHEEGGLYQLLLQVVLFPTFCYIVSISCISNLKRHSSIVFSAIILLTLFYRECFLDNSKWQKTKSAHMLMSMKAMAILFDLQSDELHRFPSIAQYSGYMLCAGTVYLGPFLSFQEYNNAFLLPIHWNKAKVCRVVWKIIISLFCFVLSICVVEWALDQILYPNENNNVFIEMFLTMYKKALEFRTGHYFVAYVSTVFAIVCGYQRDYKNEISVTHPLVIEFPQSMLHVVVHWNTPMHNWLKKYVFEEVLKYGDKKNKHRKRIIAVGATYLISSLLHGLERRLSAVLLSLAAYTYVEHLMRTKLALKFPSTFSHYSKHDYRHHISTKYLSSSDNSTWPLWFINIMFAILNIIHLAYLGSIMDMSVNNSESIAYQDSFASWHNVFYFSHFIMLFMYLISIIL